MSRPADVPADAQAQGSDARRPASLRLRRKPADRTPLVRLSWPSQPVLGSLDFDDTEGA